MQQENYTIRTETRPMSEPKCQHYCSSFSCFLGNTINLPVELSPQPSIIGNKYEKNIYLFIGTKKYIKSALQLANAIIELNKTTSGKVVGHFIGISSKDFPFENPDIICHGYLSKSNPEQFQLYISLLESSKFIVNTTNGWAGINSLVEAMFFYTPVIVSTFEEFVDHFGQQIDFGFYCESSLFSTILESYRISYDEYFKLCENSHNRVRCWNWLSFTQKLILEIK
jgi:glycosyltransferase involved in cell wall biosynthesis